MQQDATESLYIHAPQADGNIRVYGQNSIAPHGRSQAAQEGFRICHRPKWVGSEGMRKSGNLRLPVAVSSPRPNCAEGVRIHDCKAFQNRSGRRFFVLFRQRTNLLFRK